MSHVRHVFIGSSTAGKRVADAVRQALESGGGIECRPWFAEVFRPSRTAIEDLERVARSEVDAAVLVLGADDVVDRGQGPRPVTRDNVIFELGLFMGALGRAGTFGLKCAQCRFDLPTDLLGVTWVTFHDPDHPHQGAPASPDPVSQRERLIDALRPAAEQIRAQLEDASPEPARASGSADLLKVYPVRAFVHSRDWRRIISDVHEELWLYGMAEHGYALDPDVPRRIEEAASRNCKIRILLLAPESEATRVIDEEEENTPNTLRIRIDNALLRFGHMRDALQARWPGRMEIKVYDSRPVLSIVRGDERMLVTPYVRYLAGDFSPTFEMRRSGSDGIFDRYGEHFRIAWERARPWQA